MPSSVTGPQIPGWERTLACPFFTVSLPVHLW
jgi:hypothetical protein